MSCPKAHRYVIAEVDGSISPTFDDRQEALKHYRTIPESRGPLWVAFHEVGVKQLVENPHTIESYCFEESDSIESEGKVEPSVDLKKRS
jgi:hypothetical protein